MTIVEDQSDVAAFLSRPRTYGIDGPVERIDTHGAMVFLAGDRAYKLKRAVKFPYMDYSTPARRKAMCEAELAVNRRTAPALYLDVVPVVRRDGMFSLGGAGTPADWLVVMQRFDQENLLDRVAMRGDLDTDTIRSLSRVIADFHGNADPVDKAGGAAAMFAVVDGLAKSFDEVLSTFSTDILGQLIAALRAEIGSQSDVLDSRAREGWVRRCHGDLHLRNVCLIDGRPVIFDAIEFDERIATIDVMYDFAFLLMDLVHRNLHSLANAAMNEYLSRIGGYDGLAAMPLFLALRSAIRALVTATAATAQQEEEWRRQKEGEANAYLTAALDFLAREKAQMVAVGGFSGTGKTTVARGIAPALGRAPGAVILRSDEIRKELMGVEPLERLPRTAYAPEVSERVYETLFARARTVAGSGQSVILDAVFNHPEGRATAEEIAKRTGVAFVGLWLEAPPEVLESRVTARRGDASDANAVVVRGQLRKDAGPIDWTRIDASLSRDAVVALASAAIVGDVDANQ